MRHSSIAGISCFHRRVYKAGNPGARVTLAERSGFYQRLSVAGQSYPKLDNLSCNILLVNADYL